MGYDKEVEMVSQAHSLDMFTAPYVFDENQAKIMAEVGADMLVAHVGLTTSGTIGAAVAISLDEAIERVATIIKAGQAVREDILIIYHGGPFDEPNAVGKAMAKLPGSVGFFGASSIERLPAERGITEQVRAFKSLMLT